MRPSHLTALALTCLLALAANSCSRPENPRSKVAAPIVAILEAAKHSDTTQFREAYSSRIRQETGQQDWSENLKEAQATLKEKFGDYRLSDFDFSFAGDDAKGKLEVTFKGKAQFAIAVVKEGGAWKLDER